MKNKNNSVEKTLEVSSLFYFYKVLLTDKQVEYFELYFEEDLSFQEIADEKGVSKTAIHDAINKTIKTLTDLEGKLMLRAKNVKIIAVLESFTGSKNDQVDMLIEKIKEVI